MSSTDTNKGQSQSGSASTRETDGRDAAPLPAVVNHDAISGQNASAGSKDGESALRLPRVDDSRGERRRGIQGVSGCPLQPAKILHSRFLGRGLLFTDQECDCVEPRCNDSSQKGGFSG